MDGDALRRDDETFGTFRRGHGVLVQRAASKSIGAGSRIDEASTTERSWR
jgi:hypothetical protein